MDSSSIPDCNPSDPKRLLSGEHSHWFLPTSKAESFPSVFISEPALTVVLDKDGLSPFRNRGGVLTPMTAVGDVLVRHLNTCDRRQDECNRMRIESEALRFYQRMRRRPKGLVKYDWFKFSFPHRNYEGVSVASKWILFSQNPYPCLSPNLTDSTLGLYGNMNNLHEAHLWLWHQLLRENNQLKSRLILGIGHCGMFKLHADLTGKNWIGLKDFLYSGMCGRRSFVLSDSAWY